MNDTQFTQALIRLLKKQPEFRKKLAAEIRKLANAKKGRA
jgi:hypothetical protein